MAGNRDPREEPELNAPDRNRPEAGHEEKDVNVWAVGKFAIFLAALCIGTLFILFGLFRYFQARETRRQPPPAEGVNVDARRLPPEPRLQDKPILDLKQMRDAEDQILGSYEWIDRQNGVVRLPIDRAIDILAQRGLPGRPQNEPQTAAAGVSVPTESGLGPKVQQPGGPLAGELAVGAAGAEGKQ
jgi:hypothetical protein